MLKSTQQTQTPPHLKTLSLWLTSLGLVTTSALAQTPAAPTKDEAAIELSPFVLNEKSANPYQSQQALSTSRVAMSIQDIPQTISVVSSELIQDSMSFKMLDAAKYVTPIVESTLPYGGDRYMIRGFQVSQEFIDGSVISGADGYSMSLAPFNIERIEVIKGPNAILVPGGSPGGVMNPITKSPVFKDQASVSVEAARFFGTGMNIDVNRVLSSKVAARVIAAYWYNEGYINDHYRHGYMVAPSVTAQLTPTQTLTVKAEALQNRETNLGGLPIDPSVGTDGYARIAPGLPRDWSFGNETDSRHRSTERLSIELRSKLGDHVDSRIYLMGDHVVRSDLGGTGGGIGGTGGGSTNPFTGNYEPGVTWNTSAYNADGSVVLSATPAPVTAPSTWTYSRNNGWVELEYDELHFKHEYNLHFEGKNYKSNTITGIAANTSKVHFVAHPSASRPTVAANNLSAITFPGYTYLYPNATVGGTDRTAKQNDLQVFAYENLSLLQERLQLSGGVSRFSGELTRTDTTGTDLGVNIPSYNMSDTATSLGILVKPIKSVSVYYGYNTTGGAMPGSLSAGKNASSLKVAEGNQNEFGVKTSCLDGAFTASFAYFDIVQKNYPTPNSDYYLLVSQGRQAEADLLPNPLYLDLNSKGWEFEGSYSIGKSLTLLGNYTKFKMRQPITNTRVRAVPDQAGGLYADYRFSVGSLKGFGINTGLDYKSDVVGNSATGFTTARPLPNGSFVAVQPTFKVAGRTLVNLGFSYRADTWTARLQFNNVLDKDYIMAAGSRGSLVVGDPMNVKLSVTYFFK